jgi:hypothetical protein
MITWCFDAREVILLTLKNNGYKKKNKYSFNILKWISGIAIKSFAIYIVVH